jgi:predicted N-acyltransferase
MQLTASFHPSISDIDARDWDSLSGRPYPFLRHAFLEAAEASGSVCPDTGWMPCHLTLRRGDTVVAAMPLYQKAHSWGEFVFDWSWADAYRRSGLDYYPKLVSAAPFTPATGPRLLIAAGEDVPALSAALLSTATAFAREHGFSSLHVHFPEPGETVHCESAGLLLRQDCQFHWRNDDYADFDEFLAAFSAKKRKNVRRERRRIEEQGIRHRFVAGAEATPTELAAAWRLCSHTFARRGHSPYLNLDFFVRLADSAPDSLVLVLAERRDTIVAAAILLRGSSALYGRYWGSEGDYHSLHFETCYYQGIEYCIREGLELFEPGTQGEHKVSRGFLPTPTYSAHWLAHPQFAAAIEEHLQREGENVEDYMRYIAGRSPYRADREPPVTAGGA